MERAILNNKRGPFLVLFNIVHREYFDSIVFIGNSMSMSCKEGRPKKAHVYKVKMSSITHCYPEYPKQCAQMIDTYSEIFIYKLRKDQWP